MFKEKIKEALQQGHKNLGLSDEVFERVAASVETFITDEADVDKYVTSDLVKQLLKFEQADADRKRAKREGERKEPDNGNQPNPNPTPNPEPKPADEKPDFKAMFAEALAEVVNPLKEEIATFKAEQSAKTALSTAEQIFMGNDYVKKYADEAEAAWEMTNEIRKYNPNWTAEEIVNDAMSRFSKAVAKKGVNTSDPFEGDGGGDNGSLDMSDWDKTMVSMGWNTPKEN